MEIKFKASFNWDPDLQSFIFGDMNDKGIRAHAYWRKNIQCKLLLFCSVHIEVRSTICKWTVVMKNLKRSGSVLECLTRDPGIRV